MSNVPTLLLSWDRARLPRLPADRSPHLTSGGRRAAPEEHRAALGMRPRNRGTTLRSPHPIRRSLRPRSRTREMPLSSSWRCTQHRGTAGQREREEARPVLSQVPRAERPRSTSDSHWRSVGGPAGPHGRTRTRRCAPRRDRREVRLAVHEAATEGCPSARSRFRGTRR
jgi:hypothetical protein